MLEMRAAHFQHNNFPPWGGRAARGMLGGVRNRLVAAVPHFNFPSPGRAEPHGGCWVECETGSSPLFHTSTSLPLGRQSRAKARPEWRDRRAADLAARELCGPG